MREVKFEPRVGVKYECSRWGKKVMVLGESHYCASLSDATKDITNRVFLCLFDRNMEHEGWMNTYTKFASALSGQKEDRFSGKAVWDEVLFYNFVQTPLSRTRTEPTKEMKVASEGAFMEILEKFRPDAVLVWSKSRLYDHLPNSGKQGPNVAGIETWIYRLADGHEIRVLPVQHPASGFSYNEWHPIIEKFLH